ncbi:hypothetical protein BESB_052430 [Besnoitia besnoiti]|uniref:Uncharacterized protein n=1 Tax=Besnoitia besnoiti TaxID=94643 RepID=A0A2A9MJM6_BESBE|nr:hypothetical protein BESB_052430 [Besnoitia besnoiti]PFH35592.1 hypothetical protein BESB_052430 [Besnoitia besnoiti]
MLKMQSGELLRPFHTVRDTESGAVCVGPVPSFRSFGQDIEAMRFFNQDEERVCSAAGESAAHDLRHANCFPSRDTAAADTHRAPSSLLSTAAVGRLPSTTASPYAFSGWPLREEPACGLGRPSGVHTPRGTLVKTPCSVRSRTSSFGGCPHSFPLATEDLQWGFQGEQAFGVVQTEGLFPVYTQGEEDASARVPPGASPCCSQAPLSAQQPHHAFAAWSSSVHSFCLRPRVSTSVASGSRTPAGASCCSVRGDFAAKPSRKAREWTLHPLATARSAPSAPVASPFAASSAHLPHAVPHRVAFGAAVEGGIAASSPAPACASLVPLQALACAPTLASGAGASQPLSALKPHAPPRPLGSPVLSAYPPLSASLVRRSPSSGGLALAPRSGGSGVQTECASLERRSSNVLSTSSSSPSSPAPQEHPGGGIHADDEAEGRVHAERAESRAPELRSTRGMEHDRHTSMDGGDDAKLAHNAGWLSSAGVCTLSAQKSTSAVGAEQAEEMSPFFWKRSSPHAQPLTDVGRSPSERVNREGLFPCAAPNSAEETRWGHDLDENRQREKGGSMAVSAALAAIPASPLSHPSPGLPPVTLLESSQNSYGSSSKDLLQNALKGKAHRPLPSLSACVPPALRIACLPAKPCSGLQQTDSSRPTSTAAASHSTSSVAVPVREDALEASLEEPSTVADCRCRQPPPYACEERDTGSFSVPVQAGGVSRDAPLAAERRIHCVERVETSQERNVGPGENEEGCEQCAVLLQTLVCAADRMQRQMEDVENKVQYLHEVAERAKTATPLAQSAASRGDPEGDSDTGHTRPLASAPAFSRSRASSPRRDSWASGNSSEAPPRTDPSRANEGATAAQEGRAALERTRGAGRATQRSSKEDEEYPLLREAETGFEAGARDSSAAVVERLRREKQQVTEERDFLREECMSLRRSVEVLSQIRLLLEKRVAELESANPAGKQKTKGPAAARRGGAKRVEQERRAAEAAVAAAGEEAAASALEEARTKAANRRDAHDSETARAENTNAPSAETKSSALEDVRESDACAAAGKGAAACGGTQSEEEPPRHSRPAAPREQEDRAPHVASASAPAEETEARPPEASAPASGSDAPRKPSCGPVYLSSLLASSASTRLASPSASMPAPLLGSLGFSEEDSMLVYEAVFAPPTARASQNDAAFSGFGGASPRKESRDDSGASRHVVSQTRAPFSSFSPLFSADQRDDVGEWTHSTTRSLRPPDATSAASNRPLAALQVSGEKEESQARDGEGKRSPVVRRGVSGWAARRGAGLQEGGRLAELQGKGGAAEAGYSEARAASGMASIGSATPRSVSSARIGIRSIRLSASLSASSLSSLSSSASQSSLSSSLSVPLVSPLLDRAPRHEAQAQIAGL